MILPDDIKELIKRDLPKKPIGELLQDLQRDFPEALDDFLSRDNSERRQWIDSKIGAVVEVDKSTDLYIDEADFEVTDDLSELHWLTPILRFKSASSEEHEIWAKQIEAGLFAQEKLESPKEILDAKVVKELKRIVEMGESSNQLFIKHNLRLVWSIARKSPKLLSTEEHFQNGTFGLIRGIQGWDWRKGFQFSTYASWWIRQSIWRAMADTANVIRLPVHVLDKINSESKNLVNSESVETYCEDHESELDSESVADLVKNEFTDSVTLGKNAIYRNYSYEMIAEKYEFLLEYEIDEFEDTTFDYALQSLFCKHLNEVLEDLTSREGRVIRSRYGLIDGETKTLEEIGMIFGLTRERIRQIESKVLTKLRHPSRSEELKDYLDANLSKE
jgi:RNA polymerase primary sigma factor